MKIKYLISILAIFMILSFQSCLDLKETVYDQISADNFGKTNSEINSIIGPVYNTLKLWHLPYLYLSECSGDMGIILTRKGGDWYDGGQYRDLHMHTWNANTGSVKTAWDRASQAIASCNLIYETVNSTTALTDENKAAALAEIRGVRAFWLYTMCDYWGNVPLAVDFKDTSLPKTKTRQEVFDYVMSELTDIKDILRSDVSAASYGKFTKGAAYTLLAKMYLNATAWGVTTKVSNNWQATVDACDVVLGLGYALEANWKDNFKTRNDGSKEAILAACYSTNDAGNYINRIYNRSWHYLDPIAQGGSYTASNGICAQTTYAQLFETSDIRLAGSFLMGPQIDPKTGLVLVTAHFRPLIHTITITQIPGSEYAGSTWGQVNQEDGYRVFKWEVSKDVVSAMDNDIFILRLPDVYLMKAEALVRLGTNNTEATRLVNVIRARGFGGTSHNYASVTLNEVALERKLEFAWECVSRQDNIRFGTFQNARFLKQSTAGQTYKNIFPVPRTALDANSNLVQNPGY